MACLAIGLLALGCQGNGTPTSGDHAGQLNGLYLIAPSSASVAVGQTLRFTATSPWGSGASWSVLPTTGGTIDAEGKFTASSVLGNYQIVAMWKNDVRYTATATVTVVPSFPPSPLNLKMVQAFGGMQTSAEGNIRNGAVGGEPVPSQRSASVSGAVLVKHGFPIPPAR